MPQAILQVLVELLSLNHADYWEEIREFERRIRTGEAEGDRARSILERLADELSLVPDDEAIESWEQWLRPLQGILSEEMELIDRMPGDGPKASGEFRLLQILAVSFRLMEAPSPRVCDWVFSETVDCPEPSLRGLFVRACVRHLGVSSVRDRLQTLVDQGPVHLKSGAAEAMAHLAD